MHQSIALSNMKWCDTKSLNTMSKRWKKSTIGFDRIYCYSFPKLGCIESNFFVLSPVGMPRLEESASEYSRTVSHVRLSRLGTSDKVKIFESLKGSLAWSSANDWSKFCCMESAKRCRQNVKGWS